MESTLSVRGIMSVKRTGLARRGADIRMIEMIEVGNVDNVDCLSD